MPTILYRYALPGEVMPRELFDTFFVHRPWTWKSASKTRGLSLIVPVSLRAVGDAGHKC
jgi:hypothetical protein